MCSREIFRNTLWTSPGPTVTLHQCDVKCIIYLFVYLVVKLLTWTLYIYWCWTPPAPSPPLFVYPILLRNIIIVMGSLSRQVSAWPNNGRNTSLFGGVVLTQLLRNNWERVDLPRTVVFGGCIFSNCRLCQQMQSQRCESWH